MKRLIVAAALSLAALSGATAVQADDATLRPTPHPVPRAVVSGCRDVLSGAYVLWKCDYIAPNYQYRVVITCVTNGAYRHYYGNWTRTGSYKSCPDGWQFFRVVGTQYRAV